MSIKEKIKGQIQPNSTYSASDFTQFGKKKAVYSSLGRLVDEGSLERVSRGKYRAKGGNESKSTPRVNKTDNFISRYNLFNRIGVNYSQDRDTWHALGYHRTLKYKDFYQEFKRGNIAKRIINASPKATWRNHPSVVDSDGDKGEFAAKWQELVDKFALYKQFERADIKARIGRYGVMLFGLPGDMEGEVRRKGADLLYINSFPEDRAEIREWEDDTGNPRFGLPKVYVIDMVGNILGGGKVPETRVHYSRTLHIAEDPIDDSIHGTPALEAVFNNLFDLLKVVGGSAEAVWKTFDRGMAILLDKDAELSEEDEDGFNDEIENYVHHQQRFMKLQGADVKSLGAQAADPRGHFQTIASIIAGTTGIPQRVLFGSERGQLASTQDEKSWNAQIKERQRDYAEPDILRPFIGKCIEFGILPEPKGRITVTWPDLSALSESEQVQNAKMKAQAAMNLERVTFLSQEEKREIIMLPKEMTEGEVGDLPTKVKEEQGLSRDSNKDSE